MISYLNYAATLGREVKKTLPKILPKVLAVTCEKQRIVENDLRTRSECYLFNNQVVTHHYEHLRNLTKSVYGAQGRNRTGMGV